MYEVFLFSFFVIEILSSNRIDSSFEIILIRGYIILEQFVKINERDLWVIIIDI